MLTACATRSARACLALFLLVGLVSTGCNRGFLRQYEYDEDIILDLDGSATVYVNSSVPALVALRGVDLDIKPSTRVDRAKVKALFDTPNTRVVRVSTSRRSGRRFVHVRLEVDDIRKMSANPMFGWATVRFERMDDLYRFRQDMGGSANKAVGDVGWKGDELVAFSLHLPSKIPYHNAGKDGLMRGNILRWEQSFKDRLAGVPLEMEARMEPTSILYRTLWLFIGSMAAAFTVLALIIWWVVKRSKGRFAEIDGPGPQ